MATRRAVLSPRDMRWLVAGSFVAEFLIIWLFLIDPGLSRIRRFDAEIQVARAALSIHSRDVAGSGKSPVRQSAPGPSPAMAAQHYLSDRVGASGAELLTLAVARDNSETPFVRYRGSLVVAGSHSAVARLIRDFGSPAVHSALETFSVRPRAGRPGQLQAELTVAVYFPPPARVAPAASR